MQIWQTPEGHRPIPGKSFEMLGSVEQEMFGWDYEDTGKTRLIPVLDQKTGQPVTDEGGQPAVKHEKIMRKVRVSKGFKSAQMGIRYPRTWARQPDAWKESIGLIKVVRGAPPEGYSPLLHTLEDGDIEDGVINQILVDRELDDIRSRYFNALDVKKDYYQGRAEIKVGDFIIPVGDRAISMLSLARGVDLAQGVMIPVGRRRYKITGKDVEDIGRALATHHISVGARVCALGEEIEKAEKLNDFASIDIEAGWPVVFSE